MTDLMDICIVLIKLEICWYNTGDTFKHRVSFIIEYDIAKIFGTKRSKR